MSPRWMVVAVLGCGACGSVEPVPGRPDAAQGPAPPASSVAAAPSATAAATAADEPPPVAAAETLDPRFVPLMKTAFQEYMSWGRWDDEMRWAPWLCRMPRAARARMSDAEDGGHARKLYSVFAKQRGTYGYQAAVKDKSQAVGQAIVKEAYHPELVESERPEDSPIPAALTGTEDHFRRYAKDGERLYRAGRLAGIYVMTKVAPGTDGTDAGWVYGTVTPDGQVTSAGRVASCLGCHVDAGGDRVFGAVARTESGPGY